MAILAEISVQSLMRISWHLWFANSVAINWRLDKTKA